MGRLEDLMTWFESPKLNGWVRRPIPDPVDDDVREFLGLVRDADPETRTIVRGLMSINVGNSAKGFAERMASLAVRTGDARHVREGVEAAVLAERVLDPRDVVLIVSLLYCSLEKLGVEPSGFFAEAVDAAEAPEDSWVRSYPSRSPKHRSIQVMGFREGRDADGFRYETIDPPPRTTREEVEAWIRALRETGRPPSG